MNLIFTPVFPLSTFLIICFELLILSIAIFQCAISNGQSNRRFLILILFFLQYNIVNSFLPNWDYDWVQDIYISILFQNVLAYSSGIFLASYYFYYLIVELDIEISRTFNVRVLIASLFISFVILYCGTFIVTHDKDLARVYFISIPCIIALYFAYNTVRFIIKNRKEKSIPYYRWISFSGYVGIIFMATMPVVLIWGDQNKGLNHALVNVSMLLTVYSHFRRIIQLQRKRMPNLGTATNEKYIRLKKALTTRELEIASLMVSEMTYEEIAETMYIASATVRSHARNICKKCDVSGRNEFKIEYRKVKNFINPFRKLD